MDSPEELIRRIEWLERRYRGTEAALAALRDGIGRLNLDLPGAGQAADAASSRLVILFPDDVVAAATFVPAIPYSAGPPEVAYVPPRIVPETGTGRIWQTYDRATGELRAREFVSRWDPDLEPEPGPVLVDATVEYDNINPHEGIPANCRYVICTPQGGRLIAVSWDCGPA